MYTNTRLNTLNKYDAVTWTHRSVRSTSVLIVLINNKTGIWNMVNCAYKEKRAT